jgi:hypothetical protein
MHTECLLLLWQFKSTTTCYCCVIAVIVTSHYISTTAPTCLLPCSYPHHMHRNTEHDCFPIVDVDSGGVLVGTILRKCLTVLLKHKAFDQQQQQQQSTALHHRNSKSLYHSSTSSTASHTTSTNAIPLVNWAQLENIYPRYPSIDSVVLSADDRKSWIDLRPYVNTAPYVINGEFVYL